MCGILGTIPSSNETKFKSALNRLEHRGPDGFGIETIENSITLGHRRLAIVDLSDGAHQPMYDKTKRYCVIFNGEIYNFLEIKKELEAKGHAFCSSSDTEVLLYSYIEWGEECVLKFNGMWAFAIWDNQKKELFLSRDRFGKKPLFYASTDGKFIFASEMKAIYPFLKEIRPSQDFHWMKDNIFSYEATEKCLIDGIKRFPFGHNGIYKNGNLKSYVDYGKNDWQHAFVASFPGTPLDESHFAKIVVDHIGIEATYINIEPLKYWDNLEKYFYMFEDLYITSPIPMMATYGAVKKHGTTVTLDGHGADELFSGYGHLVEALWNSKFSIKNSIDILNTYQETLGNGTQFDRNSNFNIYVKFMIKKIAKIIFGKEIRSKDANHKNFKKLDSFSQQLYIIFHETILPTLLRNYDRYSMTNSVEIRMPFMDHRIVSFVTSLPYSSKFGNGYTKKLIRDAIDPYMPKEITWRKSKIGFNSPIVDWMQGDLKEWFLDTVHEKGFMESSLIDNPSDLQSQILSIVNKNTNSYVLAENSWKNLTPYIWEKAIKKFGASNNATN